MSIEIKIKKTLGKFQLNLEMKSNSRRIGILGASGCGKSMTLRSIAGIEKPGEGRIVSDGKILYDFGQKINLKPQERKVGYLFQNYALFPAMTVRENIAAGLKGTRGEKEERVSQMVDKFQLKGLENRLPGELSGGQQQRVALARIIAYEPEMILLDEPFSALDVFLKDRLQQEMQDMLKDYKGTVILVSHSRDEIYRFSDELLIMDKGRDVCFGKTADIFRNPQCAEAARLTGCKNIIRAERKGEHVLEVPGWGMSMKLEQTIPENIRYLGIRAHDFIPVWGERKENCIPAVVDSMAELPFERKYFLKCPENQEEDICWFLQRDRWESIDKRGMPDYLLIPQDKVMLLR